MPRGCDHSVHVKIDDRKFIVEYDSDGNALRIKERKMYGQYPIEGWYNASYWVASSHVLGSGNTMPKRILAAALAKLKAEHEADLATP